VRTINTKFGPRTIEAELSGGGKSRPGDRANGNTVGFCRAFGGPTVRRQPKPKRLDWDDAGRAICFYTTAEAVGVK
jgi:hypothetical protein